MKPKSQTQKFISTLVTAAICIALSACGKKGDPTASATATDAGGGGTSVSLTTNTYATSSTSGDFSQWTISNQDAFTVAWSVVDENGAVVRTISFGGTCQDFIDPVDNERYGAHICQVLDTDDSDSVPIGATFDVMEFPGVAVLVHPRTAAARRDGENGQDEIHVGFSKGNCGDIIDGDYSFIHTQNASDPGRARDIFGLYEVRQNFAEVAHIDFQLLHQNGAPVANYNTNDGGYLSVTTQCENGVYTIDPDGEPARGTLTESGLFILDFPYGRGGLVSFRTDLAAEISDFANKSFNGIHFGSPGKDCQSEDCTSIFKVRSDSTNAQGYVPIPYHNNTDNEVPEESPVDRAPLFVPASALSVLQGDTDGDHVLSGRYPRSTDIPGMFAVVDSMEDGADLDSIIVMMAMKYEGKVLFFGSDLRRTTDNQDADGDYWYVSGQFIGFEE